MHNHVGADLRVCPDEKENSNEDTKNRANTEVCPYKSNLPEGWVWKTVGNVCQIIRGVSYKKEQAREEPAISYLPILRATNIQDHTCPNVNRIKSTVYKNRPHCHYSQLV